MRHRVTGRIRIVATAIAAQCLCLAVGLLVQNRYIRATVMGDAERQSRSAMLEQWGEALSGIAHGRGDRSINSESQFGDLEKLLTQHRPQGAGRFLAIDRSNHIRYVDRGPDTVGDPPPVSYSGRVEFTALDTETSESVDASIPGTLALGENEYPAIAWPRSNGDGYLVVYAATDPTRCDSGHLLAALPAIGAMTWVWTSALLGIFSYLLLSKLQDRTAKALSKAESDGYRQRQHVVRTRDAVIFGLAKLAESRDSDTGDHLERIPVYSTMLAQALSRNPKYAQVVTPTFVRNLGASSVLHDIGKVGIEDRILLKPGRFTSTEREDMETHCRIAGDCLSEIEQRLGRSNFLEMAREIALCHHEWWDGGGYPQGLKGEQIPLAARIVAIADVYDALRSRRVYKAPKSHEECVQLIREGAGRQFDPDLVEIWLTLAERFAEIARRYADDNQTSSVHGDGRTPVNGPIGGDTPATRSDFTKSMESNLEPDYVAATD